MDSRSTRPAHACDEGSHRVLEGWHSSLQVRVFSFVFLSFTDHSSLVSPLLNTPLRPRKSNMPFIQMENIALFLTAISQPPISLPPPDLFLTVDLYENKDPAQVVQTLNAFSRVANKLKPNVYPTAIGGRTGSAALSPQSTSGGAPTPYTPSRLFPRSQSFAPASPNKPAGLSSPKVPMNRAETTGLGGIVPKPPTPLWNVVQYGGPGGASQGELGVSFGGVRQITSPGPTVPNLREKEERRKREEAARRKQEEEEAQRREEEYRRRQEEEALRAEEEAWIRQQEEARRLQEEEERAAAAAAEEQRLWELEESARRKREELRQEEERIASLRRRKEDERRAQEEARRAEEDRIRREQESHAARERERIEADRAEREEQRRKAYESHRAAEQMHEEDLNSARERERARIMELERELQRARERERQYEMVKENQRRKEVQQRRREAEELVQRPLRTGDRGVRTHKTGERPADPTLVPTRTGGDRDRELRTQRMGELRNQRTGELRTQRTGELRNQRSGELRQQRTGGERNHYIRSHVTGSQDTLIKHRTGERDREIIRIANNDAPVQHPMYSGQESNGGIVRSHKTGGSIRDRHREERESEREREFLQDAYTRYRTNPEDDHLPDSPIPQRALPTPPRKPQTISQPALPRQPSPSRPLPNPADYQQQSKPSWQQRSNDVSSPPASQTSPTRVNPIKPRWGGSSFLEREREKERQRQKEWEREQLEREGGEYGRPRGPR